jgi:hypothetical protein
MGRIVDPFGPTSGNRQTARLLATARTAARRSPSSRTLIGRRDKKPTRTVAADVPKGRPIWISELGGQADRPAPHMARRRRGWRPVAVCLNKPAPTGGAIVRKVPFPDRGTEVRRRHRDDRGFFDTSSVR